MFILQQLEARRLLPRQVNISSQLVHTPCSDMRGAGTSDTALKMTLVTGCREALSLFLQKWSPGPQTEGKEI